MWCEQTFILFETSSVLKKDKCSSVENTLMLKFDKAILKKKNVIYNIYIIINVINSIISLKCL